MSKEGRPHHPRQKKLDDRCQSHIKSEVTITSVVQCIEELVLNSLDSQPKCISIRLDASKYNIQVVDNGTGINKNSMLKIGERYYLCCTLAFCEFSCMICTVWFCCSCYRCRYYIDNPPHAGCMSGLYFPSTYVITDNHRV